MSHRTDILLSMSRTWVLLPEVELIARRTDDYMQQIVTRQKDHEFRRRLYPPTVARIWFYETAPVSAVTYICEIAPARTRGAGGGSPPLHAGGLGNAEFNARHVDWVGYDYAYPLRSCWKLVTPVSLASLKTYGVGGAPRGMVYVPERLKQEVVWNEQERVW
ncbi:hypothetical protein Q5752_006481 [Cryptotrichosporon argae]